MKKAVMALALTIAFPVFAQTAVKVNGDPIPMAEFKKVQSLLKNTGLEEKQAEQIALNILITEKIIGQEAWRQRVAQSPSMQRELSEQRTELYRRGIIEKYLQKNPVTPEEVQQTYEQLKGQYNPTEIKVRHIWVKTEKEAEDLLRRIEDGEDMAELAEKYSLDEVTAKNGGVIPFANPAKFTLTNFASEAMKLKKGEIRKQPFKSEVGYHVMKLEDSREVPFPELAQIKSEVESQAAYAKARDYILGLYRKAKVVGVGIPLERSRTAPQK